MNNNNNSNSNNKHDEPSPIYSNFLVVGLNPAYQKRLLLKQNDSVLIPGNVHRIHQVLEGIGGKGQDVTVSLSILGILPDLLQFVGADAGGDNLMQLLREKLTICDDPNSAGTTVVTCSQQEKHYHHDNDPVGKLTIRTRSKLRTCTTIVGSDNATELVEPSGVIETDELQKLWKLISNVQTNALCIMGSMPPGCPEDTYANIIATVMRTSHNALCIIDSVVGLKSMLEALAVLEARDRAVLKINMAELCKLASVRACSYASSSSATTKKDIIEAAINGFVHAFGGAELVARAISSILLTDGKDPGYIVQLLNPNVNNNGVLHQIYQMDAVDLSDRGLLFPIGAGDAVAAGTLAAWDYIYRLEGHSQAIASNAMHADVQQCLLSRKEDFATKDGACDIVRAFAFGVACGSASCLVENNSEFRLNDAMRLFQDLKAPVQLEP